MSQYSMTGFGRAEEQNDAYVVTVELKSVNHRYRDFRFKMSGLFSAWEIPMRKKLEEFFRRGSFDISINYKKAPTQAESFDIDTEKVAQFLEHMQPAFKNWQGNVSLNPTSFMKSEFYKNDEDEDKRQVLADLAMQALDKACVELEKARVGEGQKLVSKIIEHKNEYEEHYHQILPHKNSYQDKIKEKLLKRFESEGLDKFIDDNRFKQEVIYYLEKLDVDEEINRIQIHLDKLEELLASSTSEKGRQIDFLIQELNRETNTIGSKSNSEEISGHVVQMKVQLEKIREQALNLE